MNEPLQFQSIIAHHSKSFRFASHFLSAESRRDAVILYAWCRKVDDAIDLAPTEVLSATLQRLFEEVEEIYSDRPLSDPLSLAIRDVFRRRAIPSSYALALIEGMRMDVEHNGIADWPTLLEYCYRVAGVVGLMMVHILELDTLASRHAAAHMGMAMQLTNIARDVSEDWTRGRLYLPEDRLRAHGWEPIALGSKEFPGRNAGALSRVVEEVLNKADSLYESGDRGLASLPPRNALSIRIARTVYAEIGTVIRNRNCDVSLGRAFVPGSTKVRLAIRETLREAVTWPRRWKGRFESIDLSSHPALDFNRDILPGVS